MSNKILGLGLLIGGILPLCGYSISIILTKVIAQQIPWYLVVTLIGFGVMSIGLFGCFLHWQECSTILTQVLTLTIITCAVGSGIALAVSVGAMAFATGTLGVSIGLLTIIANQTTFTVPLLEKHLLKAEFGIPSHFVFWAAILITAANLILFSPTILDITFKR